MCHEFAYPIDNAKELGITVQFVASNDAPLVECVMRDTPTIRINRWCAVTARQMAQAIETAVRFIAAFASHVLGIVERTVCELPAYCVAA